MDSNYIATEKESISPTTVEPSTVEKKIEEYLHRATPRDANLVKSAKTLINNLHPKGIVHSDKELGNSIKQLSSEEVEDVRRLFREADKDTAESQHASQALIDRYTQLIKENENLKKELDKKDMDLTALGPRYKYMEKHFEDFIRMKDEYERLKEDKIKEGKFLETKNKGQQTWASSIVCESCVKTLDIVQSQDFQHYVTSRRDDSYCVTKAELMELEDKFKALKETITEREREYENRFEKAEIIHLTALNCKYRNQLQDLHKKNKQNHNWANALQRIIAKLCAREVLGELTEQEQGWVDRIVDKYVSIEEASNETAFRITDSRNSLPTSDHHLSQDDK